MTLLLLLIASAFAELPALRGEGLSLDVGQEVISVAAPLRAGTRLGLGARTAGWSPEVQVGLARPLGAPRGDWRGEALFAAGALCPWRDPALVITGTAGLRAVWERGHVGLEGRALAPLAFELLPERVLRVPLRLESALRGRLGPVWLGGRASLGGSLVTGGRGTVDAALGATLSWTIGESG